MSEFHYSPRENKAHLIHWRKWGEDALKEAQAENKLILLSIGAVWCHWCHVMDEEAYSDEANINLINERFIPVKVDNDRQPDVNRRYNMGGWPTTAVLTPEGDLLQGGTYLPAKSLTRFLQEIDQIYHENTDDIKKKIDEFYSRHQDEFDTMQERELTEDIIVEVSNMILEGYDKEYGGFGNEPKFPHQEALDFLLDEYARTNSEELMEVLDKTLTNMAGGGMFDQEVGGFFRYSTTRDWSIPHFEKIMEDNAKLLGVYTKAYQIFNEAKYKDVILDVYSWMRDAMIDHERGLFYGSQDADEHYYSLTRAEREKLKSPYVDQTIYTNWNALTISAFLKIFGVTQALDCRDIALKGLNYLMKNCYDPEEGMYHFTTAGDRFNTNLLEDQLAMVNALLDAHQVTHLKNYLEQAENLVEIILRRFHDEENGGFYIDIPATHSVRQMAKLEKPLTINSCVAEMLLRLETLTGKTKYKEVAKRTLRLCADQYQDYGLFAAPFARAVSAVLHGITHITIVGNFDDPTVRALYQEALQIYAPHKIVEELDPILDEERIQTLGYDPNQHQAYVCRGTQCYPPVTDPEELSGQVATKAMQHKQEPATVSV